MTIFLTSIIGYCMGCIQTSYIIGKIILKKDIRELGNGNAGASNATVVFGRRFGIITAVIDILKALISLIAVRLLFGDLVNEEQLIKLLYLNGLFVIFGHNFPFYMNFKGGKGTAALFGVLLGLDYKLGLAAFVVMLAVTIITDYIVIGTMSLLVVLLINTLLFHNELVIIMIDVLIILMSVYKHRQNFINIKNGSEKRVRKSLIK